MQSLPEPPDTDKQFIARYPDLGHAWQLIGRVGENGPLDEKTARLVKFGIAIGAMREGAVHSNLLL